MKSGGETAAKLGVARRGRKWRRNKRRIETSGEKNIGNAWLRKKAARGGEENQRNGNEIWLSASAGVAAKATSIAYQ